MVPLLLWLLLSAPTAVDRRGAPADFDEYWYQGLAELDRYELTQARYGELHDGEAVLIFVTEDFLTGPQIKFEYGPPDGAESVLKLNAYRRFYTGVYPYTVMTTVFQPADDPRRAPWKLASVVTEWCGTAYLQLNRDGEGYRATLHSYFQAEGDQEVALPDVTLEDALFVAGRRDPGALPVGALEVIPAAHHLRMAHLPLEARSATGALSEEDSGAWGDEPAQVYTLSYDELDRRVEIAFEQAFPHRVLAWSEGPREDPRGALTTRAVLTHSELLDYWNHHGVDDAAQRDILGLTF